MNTLKLSPSQTLVLSIAVLAMFFQSCCKEKALPSADWKKSQWISVADAPIVKEMAVDGTRAADGANWFACVIDNNKDVAKAEWMTTALGVYDLYVNGQLIGDEVLKPGFTHPDRTRRAFTHDITSAYNGACGATNVLAAQVTPGWWADRIVTPWGYKGMLGRKCAFRSVVRLTYTDGTVELIGTDTKRWKAGIAGPVRHAAIFDGEIYDARFPMGYDCLESLSTPEHNYEFTGDILQSCGAEVYQRADLALAPVEAYAWETAEGDSDQAYGRVVRKRQYGPGDEMHVLPGENLVVDFGQNCAAVPAFTFRAKEGTTLVCLPGEILNDSCGLKSRGMDGPEGSVHRLNLRIPDAGMRLQYTFAGTDAPVAYTPRATFFGYRYVTIEADDTVWISDIKSVPVTSISEDMEIGRITTGNDMINKLISNTLWGQRSNYLSVPTDCPQRNERLGWTADTQVFAETGTYFANTANFLHKWMRDLRDSQSQEGAYPGVAPLRHYGEGLARVGWADAGVIVPWTVWKQFGDASIVDENWESMERYIDYIARDYYDHKAHVKENGNYQWADWLSYEPLESHSGAAFGPYGPLPDAVDYWSYLSACYLVMDAEMMADMAAATKRDASKYQDMADKTRDYIRKRFLLENGDFKTDILNTMQTPDLFALKTGVDNETNKERRIQRLRTNFAEHGNCLQTGFLGTSILMPTLTDNGMSDLAYDLLFQRRNPSWLHSIDNSATTIWERWNSYTREHGLGPRDMNSFNHYAYGCVCQWIWSTCAGIASDPRYPGYRHIIMKPVPDRRLGSLDASYLSAAGLVKSSWRYEGDNWHWTFTIPEGSTAEVTLPGETESRQYEAGEYTLTANLP